MDEHIWGDHRETACKVHFSVTKYWVLNETRLQCTTSILIKNPELNRRFMLAVESLELNRRRIFGFLETRAVCRTHDRATSRGINRPQLVPIDKLGVALSYERQESRPWCRHVAGERCSPPVSPFPSVFDFCCSSMITTPAGFKERVRGHFLSVHAACASRRLGE